MSENKETVHVENQPECPHCYYPDVALKVSGVVFSGLAAGGTLLTTLYFRPMLHKLPTNEAYRAFDLIYGVGKVCFPIFSVLGTASLGGAAYLERHPKGSRYKTVEKKGTWYNPTSSRLLAYSAAALFAILPYTRVIMWPTLTKLFAIRANAIKGQDVKDLLHLWSLHHLARVILTFVSFTGAVISSVVM